MGQNPQVQWVSVMRVLTVRRKSNRSVIVSKAGDGRAVVLVAGVAVLMAAGGLLTADEPARAQQPTSAPATSQPSVSRPQLAGAVATRKDQNEIIPAPTVVLKPGETPKIDFESPTFQFEPTYAGTDIEHEFWFTNTGSGPLEILLVKPSCGCTVPEEFDRIIAPGESGRIQVKLKTAKLSGQITKDVSVYTNIEGVQSKLELLLLGTIKPRVLLTPKKVEFGSVAMRDVIGKRMRKVVLIERRGEELLELSPPRTSNPVFKPTLETVEAGNVYRLTVTLGEPLRTGSNGSLIEMDTNISDFGKISIPAAIYVRAPVEISPSLLVLTRGRRTDSTKGFSVVNNGMTGVALSDLKFSNPKLKGELKEITPGFAWMIRVDIPVDYHPPETGDTLSLRTSHSEIPELVADIVERAWSGPNRDSVKGAAPAHPESPAKNGDGQ